MDVERASMKAKSFVVDGSKRGRPKERQRNAIEKDMLGRGLKKSDAQDLT